MDKSRGGLSTKTHATVDALGNPLRLLLTPGQASEYEQAAALIDGFTCDAVLADKGYDSAAFVNAIQCMGAEVVIPSKRNRLHLAHWIGISTRRATWWSVSSWS